MSSATSLVRQALEEYLEGRRAAEQVVEAVAVAYYNERPGAARERLRPVVEVIERVAPGSVELHRTTGSGFGIAASGRPFPGGYQGELRAAVEAVLGAWEAPAAAPQREPGFLARLAGAIRRFFKS